MLTDIIASLVSAAAVVLLLRVWTPVESPDLTHDEVEGEPVTIGGGVAGAEGQVGRGVSRPAGGGGVRSTRPTGGSTSAADVTLHDRGNELAKA